MSGTRTPDPICLNYLQPRGGNRDRSFWFSIFDAFAVAVTVASALTFVEACQTNLKEAPMNGGGSSYRDGAPCNEAWQKRHPEMAKAILSIQISYDPLLLLLLPCSVPFFPLAGACWMGYRVRSMRGKLVRRCVMLLSCVLSLAMLPWLSECVIVILD